MAKRPTSSRKIVPCSVPKCDSRMFSVPKDCSGDYFCEKHKSTDLSAKPKKQVKTMGSAPERPKKGTLDFVLTFMLVILLVFFAGMAFGLGSIYGAYLLGTWIPCG